MDWKWFFIYPEQGIATVNEIAFPANTPVYFKVTSNSVMNSFFIPRLGSQIYAMAGMQHVFDFENMVDTRNTGQGVANSQTLVFIFCANFDVIPVADDSERLIIVL